MQLKKVLLEKMTAGELVSYIATLDEIPQELAKELAERYTALYTGNVVHDNANENVDAVAEAEDEIDRLQDIIRSAISMLEDA